MPQPLTPSIDHSVKPLVFHHRTAPILTSGKDAIEINKQVLIKNESTHQLVLKQISTTCGCSYATLDQKVIEPGKSTPLNISVTLAGVRGETSVDCYLEYESGEKFIHRFHFEILPDFQIIDTTEYISFNDIDVDKHVDKSIQVLLFAEPSASPRILSVESSNESLTCSFTPVESIESSVKENYENQAYRIDLLLFPKPRISDTAKVKVLYTHDPTSDIIYEKFFYISWNLRTDYLFSPEKIYIDENSLQTGKRIIEINNSKKESFDIQSCISASNFLSVDQIERISPDSMRVILSFDASQYRQNSNSGDNVIKLKINGNECIELDIPIIVM